MTKRIGEGNPGIPVPQPKASRDAKSTKAAARATDVVESDANISEASSGSSSRSASPASQGLKVPQTGVSKVTPGSPPDLDSDEDDLEPFVLNPKAFFAPKQVTYMGGCPVDDDDG